MHELLSRLPALPLSVAMCSMCEPVEVELQCLLTVWCVSLTLWHNVMMVDCCKWPSFFLQYPRIFTLGNITPEGPTRENVSACVCTCMCACMWACVCVCVCGVYCIMVVCIRCRKRRVGMIEAVVS